MTVLYEEKIIFEHMSLEKQRENPFCEYLDENTGLPTAKYIKLSQENANNFGNEFASIIHVIRCSNQKGKIVMSYKIERVEE